MAVKAGACFAYTLFGLSWLSWIVMLGGVAGMQAKCGGYLGRILFPIPGDTNSAVFEDCSTTNTTAFIWWTVWFSFFLLILLSVAECGRVHGLYLTKQIFLAMSTVCLMLAADRSHVVADTFEGALRHAAQATLAGQVVTMMCNLVMLLYFGGELAELRSGGKFGEPKGSMLPLSSSDLQPVGAEGNPYEAAFNRVMAAGATPATAAPESRKEHRSMKAAAAALNAGSWDVNASAV